MGLANKLRNIAWFATLKLALARSIASGAIFAVILPRIEPTFLWWEVMFSWAVGMTPALVLVYLMSLIFAPIGLTFAFMVLVIMVGDPLVYVFNKLFPRVLDVADFKLLNFTAFIIVYREPDERVDAEAL